MSDTNENDLDISQVSCKMITLGSEVPHMSFYGGDIAMVISPTKNVLILTINELQALAELAKYISKIIT